MIRKMIDIITYENNILLMVIFLYKSSQHLNNAITITRMDMNISDKKHTDTYDKKILLLLRG